MLVLVVGASVAAVAYATNACGDAIPRLVLILKNVSIYRILSHIGA